MSGSAQAEFPGARLRLSVHLRELASKEQDDDLSLAASVAEREGMMLAAGCGVFLVTLSFFASIFLGGVAVVEWLEGHFSGLCDPDDESPGIVPTRP